MATFGECFELCKISKEAELIGVEGHSKNDHVILTFTDKVLVYNISDRKIIHSWSVEPNEKLTCPVVCYGEHYYGTRDDEWLLMWDDTVQELLLSSMIMLRNEPSRIYVSTSRRFQHKPVLVYKDNQALSLIQAGKEKKKSKTKERMLACGTHMASDSDVWFSQILASEDSTKVLLVMHLFKESRRLVFIIKAPNESKILRCSLIEEDGESAFFISLWSDGGVYKTEFPKVKKADCEHELSCERMFSFCESSVSISEVPSVHLCHVALSFICVACSDKTQKDQLSFWDTKYRIMHDEKPLRDFTGVAPALRSASSACLRRLQSTASFLVVASDTGVSACAYTVVKSTLQTSLGILQHSDKKRENLKPQFLTTPKLIDPTQSIEEWTRGVSKDDETENELLCRVLDSKKTITARKLASELRKHLEKTSCADSNTGDPAVSQYFITSIFERCFKEKKLWSSETGRIIVKTRVLPQRCFPKFFSLVLENNDIGLFQDCLFDLNGISESTLVDCLKFVLRCDDDVFPTSKNTDIWDETSSPCSSSRAKYLSLVLSHSINEAFLQTSLRKLNFEETLFFVKFLLYIIKCWSITLRDWLQLEGCKRTLSYTQVLDWAALTLNAHFTQLIVIPEAQTLLVNLHKVIAEQVAAYEQLNQLHGHLSHFKKHEPLPKSDRLSAYSIETVTL